MVKLVEKDLCNGCLACYNICPTKSIKIVKDNGGFQYPEIQKKSCINCGKCNQVCTVLHCKKAERYDHPRIMAAYSKDEDIRLDSTSGGIFSELAHLYFNKSEYVSGAVYKKDYTVGHIVTKDSSKLPRLRSSKYVQSDIGSTYRKIKKLLDDNKKVLICGTPCQIMGLYNYLGRDYNNLVTCDFICRGVNSPRVFQKYITLLEHKYKSKISKIKFKNKTFGWHLFSTKIWFKNRTTYIADRYTDKFMRGYLEQNLYMRKSCHNCQFKNIPRVSDITLADFWGIEHVAPLLDDNLGTSMVMLNSIKGENTFEQIKESIVFKECTLANVRKGNPSLLISPSQNRKRESFFLDMDNMPFKDLWNKYIPDLSVARKISLFFTRNILAIKLKMKNLLKF